MEKRKHRKDIAQTNPMTCLSSASTYSDRNNESQNKKRRIDNPPNNQIYNVEGSEGYKAMSSSFDILFTLSTKLLRH
ncbi:hypothetical protein GCM10008915_25400 [Bifidobacterium pullorum subsp. gallinarum]|jgi:hypothetical protein